MSRGSLRDHFRVRPGYWFAPKLLGFGATPVTWQGWLATAIYVALLAGAMSVLPSALLKAAVAVPLTIGFVILAWAKTDGGWRWGARND